MSGESFYFLSKRLKTDDKLLSFSWCIAWIRIYHKAENIPCRLRKSKVRETGGTLKLLAISVANWLKVAVYGIYTIGENQVDSSPKQLFYLEFLWFRDKQ